MTKPLTQDDYDNIISEADIRFYRHNRIGVRGQAIMPQDSFEYWVIQVTDEYVRNFINESENNND